MIILNNSIESTNRLDEMNLTLDQIKEIAFRASSARNSAVSNHPITAPGQFSYLEGVRAMRDVLVTDKSDWDKLIDKNLEFVINKKTGDKILFQNVDFACIPDHDPQPASKRNGSYKRRVISSNQGELPNFESEVESTNTWMICVSEQDSQVSVEFSLAGEVLQSGKYMYLERIFISQDQNIDDFDKIGDSHEEGSYNDDFIISEK